MKILIYYDTSFSQVNRNQVLEFELISEYFNALGNVQVDFVPFDHLLGQRSQHRIENGDCTTLLSKISSLKWDGVALFNLLDFNAVADVILVFSDGIGVMDDLILPESKDVFLIKSVENLSSTERQVEHRNYLDISEIGVAGVLHRLGVSKENISVENVAQNRPDDRMAEFRLEGLVFDQSTPLENVTIQVKGEDRGVISDKDGRFFLEASVGDILMIGYLGMKNQEYRVTGDQFVEFYLNIEANRLDEVVLISKQESPDSKNTISTAYGEKSEDQIGYAVQEVEDEEFEGQANLSDATRGKIISYNYSQNDDLSQIQLRQVLTFGAGTKNPLIVVDNVPMGVNDSSSGTRTLSTWHIDPSNVEKIIVLRGLAATNKYGSLARGGAILIFTKTGVRAQSEMADQTNSAMVQGNIYNESVTRVKTAPEGDYLKEFKRSKSLDEAYELYQAQRDAYTDDFQYFVDVSKYMVKWGNADLSKRILLNTLELNPNSIEYLRFVGMLLQDRKDFNLALKIYEHILVLAPQESQQEDSIQ